MALEIVDYEPEDSNTELAATFEPEEELLERLNTDDVMPDAIPVDVHLFKAVLDEKLKVFIDRRGQYGNHLENAKRFPKEHEAGIYIKAARIIRDIEHGTLKRDTLIDLSNYCDIVLAEMEAE